MPGILLYYPRIKQVLMVSPSSVLNQRMSGYVAGVRIW